MMLAPATPLLQQKQILKFYWPLLLPLLLSVFVIAYLMLSEQTECQLIPGRETSLLILYIISYGIPATLLIGSIYSFIFGVYGWKQQQYPPTGFPLSTSKAVHGRKARIICIAAILFPVFALYCCYWGERTVQQFLLSTRIVKTDLLFWQKCIQLFVDNVQPISLLPFT